MSYLLNVVYLLTLLAASPWLLVNAWRHGKYRSGFGEKLLGRAPIRSSERPCAWFHAVSVGEINLLRTLLDRFNAEFPGWDCVVSTTTRTGYEMARKKYAGHTVFYCPLDFSWSVENAFRRIRPDLLILAELELWPNLIRSAKRRGCRVAIVNGRLSERSFRGYSRIPWLLGPILRQLDLIAVQNDEYAERFHQLLGAGTNTRVEVTGSVKFDGAPTDRDQPATENLRQLAGITGEEIVFLAGSTQSPEEELAVAAFSACHKDFPQLRLLLTPRHITRCDRIAQMLDRTGLPWQRRTMLDTAGYDPRARILLIDTIGELGAWWGTAHIAFVGGSLGNRGGQNMIEPAGYGATVAFGTQTRNFRDIVRMLLDCDGAVVVANGGDLTQFLRDCLERPQWATAIGQRARQLVLSQQGAADRTVRLLGEWIRDSEHTLRHRAA